MHRHLKSLTSAQENTLTQHESVGKLHLANFLVRDSEGLIPFLSVSTFPNISSLSPGQFHFHTLSQWSGTMDKKIEWNVCFSGAHMSLATNDKLPSFMITPPQPPAIELHLLQ